MAVALILDFPGGSMDQYRQVVDRMELGGRLVEGGMFHAAGIYEGGLRVTDVWTDLATFEAFRDAKILPYAQDAGLPIPEVQVVQVQEQKPGNGRVPKFVQVVRIPGIDADAFAAMDARILPDGRPPEQLTFHVNGPIEGGWCVIDAWDSQADRDRFRDERIAPVAQDAPLTGEPQFEDLTVEATLGASAPAHA
jgi:hypothetical protein